MKGPYPIICRGHSGSRLLCEAFRQNRIWMGLSDNQQRDAEEFSQGNAVVRSLVQQGFGYSELTATAKGRVQNAMVALVEKSKSNCPHPGGKIAFGWKRAITTFTCEIFLDAYPEAKTVHLVRDGRDVMLSRLNVRMRNLKNPLNRLVVFGDSAVSSYRGRPLDESVVDEYRNEIEMHHWVTAVRFGMRARRYGDRYLEVSYEHLCEFPERTMTTVFEFLDVPFLPETREWLKGNVSVQSIGKWRGREEELRDAIQIGEPLLKEIGYM
ncbi:MAG: sulfotransferase [Gemmatimonadaceae bacterium]|nr:sulfotransferase [Gemmatimonadaceae bacterium]